MRYDLPQHFADIIQTHIQTQLDRLPKSYPCKVLSVSSEKKGFVEVETLLPKEETDTKTLIPVFQSPYITLPIQEGDIGIALNCSYLFEKMLNGDQISEKIASQEQNGLFFIPLLPSSDNQNELTDTTILSQDKQNKIILNADGIQTQSQKSITLQSQENLTIQSQQNLEASGSQGVKITTSAGLIELGGANATIGALLVDILTMIQQAVASDPVAGNGSPWASPTITSQAPKLISKIKANFK